VLLEVDDVDAATAALEEATAALELRIQGLGKNNTRVKELLLRIVNTQFLATKLTDCPSACRKKSGRSLVPAWPL
jgi:hypothetical protein